MRHPGLKSSLVTLIILFSLICGTVVRADSYFSDVDEEPFFQPHIQKFFEKYFITGYTLNGVPTGKFGPENNITRAEFAKITTVTRLAEKFGETENWNVERETKR